MYLKSVEKSGKGNQEEGNTHLNTLWILQAFLQYTQHMLRLQIHDEIRRTCEHPERRFAKTGIVILSHGEGLSLESVPRPAAIHGVVGKIGDSVDGFSPDDDSGFMEEGVQEEAFYCGEGLRR